ncbi:MAG: tyrosine-type recombinase/integrase [Bacteriovoracaceae bacterium]
MSLKKDLVVKSNVNIGLAERLQEKKEGQGLEDFINEFIGNFLSADTKRAYMDDLAIFFHFLRAGGIQIAHPKDITAHQFQVYRDYMLEHKLASATINRRLVCIRSFLKWCIAVKLITHNPLDAVKLPKVSTESPTVAFDDEEVLRMIEAPNLKTQTGCTHRMIMVILFHLGVRRSELIKIRVKNILNDRGHTVLSILGKGDKTRFVPLSAYVVKEIQNYIASLKNFSIHLEAEDYLIQTKQQKKNCDPADGSTIFRIITRYARSLGIHKKVSPHSCRATVISHLLDTQATPIRDVAIFAGHSIISTTERYDKRRKNLDNSAAYQVHFEDVPKKKKKAS